MTTMKNIVLEKYFSGNYSLHETSIPLSFREKTLVDVMEGELYGKDYLFLSESKELPFSDLFQLYRRFRSSSSLPVVLLLKSDAKRRGNSLMVEAIPFISLSGFIFLPSQIIVGHFPTPRPKEEVVWRDSYLAIMQYFLLNPAAKVNSASLQAALPAYSRSFFIQGLAFLTSMDYLKKEGSVRTITYSLAHSIADSFAFLKTRILSPIRRSYCVLERDAASFPRQVLSSESALAVYSSLVPEEKAYLASQASLQLHPELLRRADERKFDEVYVRFDVFRYSPYLVHDGSTTLLNPLDVIAIYQQSDDPRVQEAIQTLGKKYLG